MAQPTATVSQDAVAKRVLAAFSSACPPIPVPLHYRLGLMVVAVAMVLLPLIYVSLIGLAGFGVYYHAVHHTGVLSMPGGGTGKLMAIALLYFGPILAGGILVLFMIKPLFAGRGPQEKPRKLIRANEPLLFAFVENLSRTIGAPMPAEIVADSQINASASFRRGILSLFGNDLVLTLGLPVAAGLNLNQFTGVLAHEFGHFAQSTGMRLTFIIRSINAWFYRVVYERDAWDQTLTEWSQESDLRIGIVFYLARVCVWLTRKILWLLMVFGHGISCFLLRQMEYDADRHEMQVTGSACLIQTMSRMTYLSVATQWAHSDLKDSWKEARLAEDLPEYILMKVSKIPEDAQEKIAKRLRESKTGLFDTHPSENDRIEAAQREQVQGFFSVDLPSTALFSDFKALSRIVTFDFYREMLGNKVKRENLRPLSELIDRQEREEKEVKAVMRYFQRQVSPLRPLGLDTGALAPPADPTGAEQAVRRARERVVELAPAYAKEMERYEATRAKQAREEIAARLAPLEAAARERLNASLQLLHDETTAARVPEAPALRQEIAALLPAFQNLNRAWPTVLALHMAHTRMMELLEQFEKKKGDQSYRAAIVERMNATREKWRAVKAALADMPYPFEHAAGPITLHKFMFENVPVPNDLGSTIETGGDVLSKSFTIYFRILGRMVLAAEAVEQAFGLPALPEPPNPEPKDGKKRSA
ncbi:MAG: M48 family metalloprotease [Planctomycetes bacterium]|nr:M48 family metalloprotease [Planctomycetota bacterium]